MEALYKAYADYLDRMYEETDDLVLVDETTVPDDVNLPAVQEWADVG